MIHALPPDPVPVPDRPIDADIRRLRAYVDLQLRFAAVLAQALGLAMGASVARHTDLHRRLGLGRDPSAATAPAWAAYRAGLDARPGHADRLAWTVATLRALPPEVPAPAPFGCFAFDPPDASGVLRLHFAAEGDRRDGAGPLARARIADRRAELRALFAHVRAVHPGVCTVRGGSWLYNVEAYTRLFPPAHVASRARPVGHARFTGQSSWGQFLDHRGDVKGDLAARFLAVLDRLDPADPGRCFPLPMLRAEAPVRVFHADLGT